LIEGFRQSTNPASAMAAASEGVRVPKRRSRYSELIYVGPTARADTFVRRRGVIYPVYPDGGIAYNAANTPAIVRGALMKREQQRQGRADNLQAAQLVFTFQMDIGSPDCRREPPILDGLLHQGFENRIVHGSDARNRCWVTRRDTSAGRLPTER